MRCFWLATLLCLGIGFAEEQKVFKLDSVIHESIRSLKPPQWYPEIISWTPAVSTISEEAQRHIHQGTALVHAGWDFEAYRHFVEAAKIDPECLMAYWGIALSLASPNTEVIEERLNSVNRMLELIRKGKGTGSERGLAEAIAYLFSNDPGRAPTIFEKVAKIYPNDLQLALMSAYMQRDGYDELLGAKIGQEEATNRIEKLLKQHPDSQMALSFWLALLAEHPDNSGELRKIVLPRARKITSTVKNFPPYHEFLGHFEYRAGNLKLAKKEFETAIKLYEEKLTQENLKYYDYPGLIKCKIYLATVLKSLGDIPGALRIAEKLRLTEIDIQRLYSPGATMLLWEGKTLSLRIHLARGTRESYQAAIKTVPPLEEGQKFARETPAVLAWEAWRLVLTGYNAVETQVFDSAEKYLKALTINDKLLYDNAPPTLGGSSRIPWLRSRKALQMHWMLIKAGVLQGQAGGKATGKASFWIDSAIDNRPTQRGTFPPIDLSSPRLQLARYRASQGKFNEAKNTYKKTMAEFPNDILIMRDYEAFLRQFGKTDLADNIAGHIRKVQEN